MIKKTYNRDMILQQAILLAKEVGFKKLTMRGLSGRLKCSVMPIYDSFESKDKLLEEVYNEIIRADIKASGYFERNREVLRHGIQSPLLYRDMREYGVQSDEFNNLYKETINLMMTEKRLKNFSFKVCESLHFDLMIYITGIVEKQMNRTYDIPNFEEFCINALNQFTEVLIRGYEISTKEENL